jgi:hypothetical protein
MFTEDLSTFFNAAEFATQGEIDNVPVTGLFDNSYLEQDMSGSGSAPTYTLPTASVPANVVGKPLVVNGITYKVVEPMPDGTGITTLRLRT